MTDHIFLCGGKYRVLKIIGKGATSRVYLCEDSAIGKKWAVKAIDKRINGADKSTFFLGILDHPAIPRIVEKFSDDENNYIVMDHIEGIPLSRYTAARKLTYKESLEAGMQLCGILSYLHHHDPPVLFRDLKPANIIITGEKKLKIVDLDSACIDGDEMFAGTEGYSAPEYKEGIYTPEGDIYAFGKTLSDIAGDKAAGKLKKVIDRCTRPDPAQRFHDADDILRELKRMAFYHNGRYGLRLVLGAVFLFLVLVIQMQDIAKGSSDNAYETAIEKGDYEEALFYRPDAAENYIELLKGYEKKGITEEGIRRTEELLEVYQPGDDVKEKVFFEIGKIELLGSVYDSDFRGDADNAASYFNRIGGSEKENAKRYIDICGIVSGSISGNEEKMARILDETAETWNKVDINNDQADIKYAMLISALAERYEREISEYTVDPLYKAAGILEGVLEYKKAAALRGVEDAGISENENYRRLADIYSGLFWNNFGKERYSNALKAIDCIELAFGTEPDILTRVALMKQAASIYRELKEYKNAEIIYSESAELLESRMNGGNAENLNGESFENIKNALIDICISRANMEFLEMKDKEAGRQTLKKIESIPGGSGNPGYIKLKERSDADVR